MICQSPNISNVTTFTDRSSPLSEKQKQEKFQPAYLLCRAINIYSCYCTSKTSIWVDFASAPSKVADIYARSNSCVFLPSFVFILPDNSLRSVEAGELLFPPYTSLGWDQKATLKFLSSDEAARLGDVICFGRSL